MARSQNSFIKKQKEKLKKQKKEEKMQKKQERKENSVGGDLDQMIAYVDENGAIISEQPSEEDVIPAKNVEKTTNNTNK